MENFVFIGDDYFAALCLGNVLEHGINVKKVYIYKSKRPLVREYLSELLAENLLRNNYLKEYVLSHPAMLIKEKCLLNSQSIRKEYQITNLPISLKNNYSIPSVEYHIVNTLESLSSQLGKEPIKNLIIASMNNELIQALKPVLFDKYYYLCNSSEINQSFFDIQNLLLGETIFRHYVTVFMPIHNENLSFKITSIIENNGNYRNLLEKISENFITLIVNIIKGKMKIAVEKNIEITRKINLTEERFKIWWNDDADSIMLLKKGIPFFYPFFFTRGEKIYVTDMEVFHTKKMYKPGKVIKTDKNNALIQCGVNAILIKNMVYAIKVKNFFSSPKLKIFSTIY